jgi:hypothetical protein
MNALVCAAFAPACEDNDVSETQQENRAVDVKEFDVRTHRLPGHLLRGKMRLLKPYTETQPDARAIYRRAARNNNRSFEPNYKVPYEFLRRHFFHEKLLS